MWFDIDVNSTAGACRSNPTWMETKFILVNSLTENLILKLWDYNDHRANTDLGFATFDLTESLGPATQGASNEVRAEKPIVLRSSRC